MGHLIQPLQGRSPLVDAQDDLIETLAQLTWTQEIAQE
jgi:hypothetical protein